MSYFLEVLEAQNKFIQQVEMALKALENSPEDISKDDFTKAVQFTLRAGVSFEDFAGYMKISMTTVKRWYDGVSCPHSLGLRPAIKGMRLLVIDKNS